MYRKFRETLPLARKQRFWQKPGSFTLLLGTVFIFLILLMALGSLVFPSSPDMDLEAQNQPPAVGWVARLMDYDFQVYVASPVSGTSSQADMFSLSSQVSEENAPASSALEENMKPVPQFLPVLRNAVVNTLFSLDLTSLVKQKITRIQLKESPSSLQFDPEKHTLSWMPSSPGSFPVRLRYRLADGSSYIYQFTIIVSQQVHPLGTNSQGFDIWEGLLRGSRTALNTGVIAVFTMMILGILGGASAGYFGGIFNRLLTFLDGLTNTFPRLVLLFIIGAIWKLDIELLMFVTGMIYAPQIAGLIRSRIKALKEQQYIEAAREAGFSELTILGKHVLWYNCRPILLTQASFGFAIAILMEVTLSYLGFGSQGPNSSWGAMLVDGKNLIISGQYWGVILPSVMITLSILGFMLLGDGFNRRYQIREGL